MSQYDLFRGGNKVNPVKKKAFISMLSDLLVGTTFRAKFGAYVTPFQVREQSPSGHVVVQWDVEGQSINQNPAIRGSQSDLYGFLDGLESIEERRIMDRILTYSREDKFLNNIPEIKGKIASFLRQTKRRSMTKGRSKKSRSRKNKKSKAKNRKKR